MATDKVCSIPPSAIFTFHLSIVSIEVCQVICSTVEDEKCSGFLYHLKNQSCVLTSFTGIKDKKIDCNGESIFVRRRRCAGWIFSN